MTLPFLVRRACRQRRAQRKKIRTRMLDAVRLIQFDSAGVELVITAMLIEQIVMAAALNDFALFKHHDRV